MNQVKLTLLSIILAISPIAWSLGQDMAFNEPLGEGYYTYPSEKGHAGLMPGTSMTAKNLMSPAFPPQICEEVPQDYVAYWPLDANLDDVSGNGYHATANGMGLTFVSGKKNNGVTGFTSGSYFTLPNLALSQASISAWVYLDAHATQKIFRGPANPPCLGEHMGNWEACGTSFGPPTLNTWHHLAIVEGVGLYVDGVFVPGSAIGALDPTANNVIYVGGAPYNEWLNGIVDEIKIFDRQLSVSEVEALAFEACPAQALHFDGIDDYVAIPNSTSLGLTNQATWQCWVNLDPLSYISFFNHNTWYDADGYYINIFGGILYYSQGTGGGLTQSTMDIPFPYNVWTQVTIVKDGPNVSFFINGTQVASSGGGHADILPTTAQLELGQQLSNQFLGGMMDEVRIWNIALTPSQIQDNYNCALVGNETGLVALYHFNQGYDGVNNAGETTLQDATANNNDGTLMDFALNGNTSNWLKPGAISDAPCVCTTFITVAPGDYNDPATWGGCVPPNPIPAGVSIIITYPVTNPVGNTLVNNGQIDFGPGGTLINEGVYTGTGGFTGTLINLGEVRPGN